MPSSNEGMQRVHPTSSGRSRFLVALGQEFVGLGTMLVRQLAAFEERGQGDREEEEMVCLLVARVNHRMVSDSWIYQLIIS